MPESYPTLAQCAVVAGAFKILLFPAYKSTDFEVHRNWLAITNTLPLSEWYYEKTSEWTLDYPPFFAYFEWLLAHAARLFDPAMLHVYNLNHESWQTVYFQRATVILTELVLAYALQMFIDTTPLPSKRAAQVAALSIFLSPGLLIIDHIHFQYNGFMYGILVLSLVLARCRATLLHCGLVFAALLCFKHIHLYLAPAYFVFLLRTYCLSSRSIFRIKFLNCVKLGGGIALIFGAAFGPFAAMKQIPQLLSHRVLIHLAPRLGLALKEDALHSVTRGLVGDTAFAVLPEIVPRVCFVLTLLFQGLPLIKLFAQPTWENFIGSITLCGYASFLFGWHVHEKAILLVIIPFSLIALRDRRHLGAFRPLAVAGHVSLFPLLFTPAEFPVKTIYTVFWLVLFLVAFDRLAPASTKPRFFLLDRFSTLYIAVSIPLIAYTSLFHQIIFGKSYEFLPLMFTSSYAAVLFKRKPVKFLPPPDIENENTEVWHIPQTGEIFATYEEYLNRMDFYKQRRFNNQITGHSGLTFFEAYSGELAGGLEVEATFPEALKGPILRKVQFQTVSRLDHLVDMIFDEFKHDYYPGEEVTVTIDGGERMHGLVRDKSTFGPRILADGSRTQPVTRYLVESKADAEFEAMVTDEHICRDRGAFTKQMLRSFIKKTVNREAWNGAPWLVKEEYAGQYHIDTRVPPHLRYDTKLQERKQLQAQKRAATHDVNGLHAGPVRLPELKPAPKSHKGKHGQQGGKGLKWPANMSVNGANGSHADHPAPVREPTPPPPPPPPKYPIEDLQLEPKEGSVRPPLKFMCRDAPVELRNGNTNHSGEPTYDHIDMASMGSLLETWDTLNVYCEIFQLDSFTFDDFVEAMSLASEEIPVQLFDEIHCSVLKILVDPEQEGGKVRITLPELEEKDSEEDEDEDDMDETAEPTPEPEPKPTGRATRGSLAKAEAERIAAEAAAAEEETLRAELESKHRAEELLREYDWIEHLRKRDFANGGWERIIVGLFHQLSKSERQEKLCEELLLQLVPPETEPTQEVVRQRYAELDINFRVRALQLLCMLTMETKAVRGYMEDCSETMTKYRKERIEWQRQRKQAVEEVRQLNEDRKAMLPESTPAEDSKEASNKGDDVKMTDADDSQLDKDDDVNATEKSNGKPQKKRRGRQSDKQRKLEEEEERKAKEKEAEDKEKTPKETVKLPPQQMKQYNKLLKEIQKKEDFIKECEAEVAILENDLREADCPRTRVLGKDRFWNRYYWFERNGMPYAGLPNSSTAYAEYANGCIWVQGPDELEREGYIDVPADLQNEYKAKFDMTIPERKAKEEGGTSIFNAKQWGYIAEPEHVDQLIRWLDPRGFNELKLRKELLNYRDKISAHMENRKKYLGLDEGKQEETTAAAATAATKRTSSRIREKTPEVRSYRCLQWENTMALEELGHLHMAQPPPPRSRKQTRKREALTEPAGRGATKARKK
ncbi:dolichyl pyrophosphate Glc1Man9GlcNAc2 alpha-1,3-glucosyltransferase [Purpureocillium lavendulum]|uniref:Dolichyl pyrophosphate Glc1Man9GlcNAc2 alpha-1,3-glucosyltransferase n=1 Tax=Purpureocillium lavendulum TaxID=1247861 RepID=A0AB34FRC0_9HYPO|nr:dolichyl pyrophosphate Glc1Man9GlcNAc2 alpha-1,3-glucosyltransferase [Purpureocillium lavendulum]